MNTPFGFRGRCTVPLLASAGAAFLWSFAVPVAIGADSVGPGLKSSREIVAAARAGIEFIGSAQLKARIAANRKLVLLDVRTKDEFDAGHLKGAAWVERGIVEFMLLRQLPDPDAEIVVYCKVGNRTALAVRSLKSAGYRNVAGLEGGFDAWALQGNSFYNYLGRVKLVSLLQRDASTPVIDFYQDKTPED